MYLAYYVHLQKPSIFLSKELYSSLIVTFYFYRLQRINNEDFISFNTEIIGVAHTSTSTFLRAYTFGGKCELLHNVKYDFSTTEFLFSWP